MVVLLFSWFDTQSIHNDNPYQIKSLSYQYLFSSTLKNLLKHKQCHFLPVFPCHFFQSRNKFLKNRSFLKILFVMSRFNKVCFKNTNDTSPPTVSKDHNRPKWLQTKKTPKEFFLLKNPQIILKKKKERVDSVKSPVSNGSCGRHWNHGHSHLGHPYQTQ